MCMCQDFLFNIEICDVLKYQIYFSNHYNENPIVRFDRIFLKNIRQRFRLELRWFGKIFIQNVNSKQIGEYVALFDGCCWNRTPEI